MKRRDLLKRVVVRSVTAAGVPSKAPLTNAEWQLNAFTGVDAAFVRAKALRALNPERSFAVCDIASGRVIATFAPEAV